MGSKLWLHVHDGANRGAVATVLRSAPWGGVKSLNDTWPLTLAGSVGIAVRVLRVYGIEGGSPG